MPSQQSNKTDQPLPNRVPPSPAGVLAAPAMPTPPVEASPVMSAGGPPRQPPAPKVASNVVPNHAVAQEAVRRIRLDNDGLLDLIEAIAAVSGAADAATALANAVSAKFPGCNVRCGIGQASLQRLYDAKLGWIAKNSPAYQSVSATWNQDHDAPALPEMPEHAKADGEGNDRPVESIRCDIDRDGGLQRSVLWISGPGLLDSDRRMLRHIVPTLRLLFWRNPARLSGSLSGSTAGLSKMFIFWCSLLAMSILVAAVWPVPYRVHCQSVVRPISSRVIAAPFAAKLDSLQVEPGDRVEAGDVLLQLDGAPLRIELEGMEAKIAQLSKERDVAIVAGRVAEGQHAELRIREFDRRRALIMRQLDQLVVTSPVSGIVLRGGLERAIGMPLEMGQALIEVAPLDQVKVEVELPDHEIGMVAVGAQLKLNWQAISEQLPVKELAGIYPSAEIRSDQNIFVGHLSVSNPDGELMPGMRGEAIVYGPMRPWLWSHLRSVWERGRWKLGI